MARLSIATATQRTQDDDLGSLLENGVAARGVRPLILTIREGSWDPDRIPAARRTSLGVLVLDGILAREVLVAGYPATELLGAGDVVDPFVSDQGLLPVSARWSVLMAARVLVLDSPTLEAATGRPDLLTRLLASLRRRSERLAVHQAIAQLPRVELRLLALFWHLGARWGRVGPQGVLLPLRLPHVLLGRLVGGQRPTVSLALRELDRRGHVRRRPDGAWQLGSVAPRLLDADEEPRPRRRRPRRQDPIDRMAAQLMTEVKRAREQAQAQAEALPTHLTRLAEVREHGARVREQSLRIREEIASARNGRGAH